MLYNKMIVAMLITGCSCTFFGTDENYAYCSSAAHCVRGETTTARIGDTNVGVRWIHIDREHDIAIGKAFKEAVGPIEGSIAQAKVGPATIIGYPNLQAAVRTADIPGREATIDGSPKTLLELPSPVVGGTSGGAVMQNGSLVGVVTHSTPAGGACTTTTDLYRATQSSGLNLAPDTFSNRDYIIAAIVAFATHWWKERKHAESLQQLKEKTATAKI